MSQPDPEILQRITEYKAAAEAADIAAGFAARARRRARTTGSPADAAGAAGRETP